MGLCTWSSSSHSRTTIWILSTEVISHSVHRAIVPVGYGTGAVPGTNGLRYEYDTFRTSVQEYAQFSIENVLLSVALRTCTPYQVHCASFDSVMEKMAVEVLKFSSEITCTLADIEKLVCESVSEIHIDTTKPPDWFLSACEHQLVEGAMGLVHACE